MSRLTRLLMRGHIGLARLLRLPTPLPLRLTGPNLDSNSIPARASLVIVGLPRTGSSLLCAGLEASGLGTQPREYLQGGWLVSHAVWHGMPVPTWAGHLELLWNQLRRSAAWWSTTKYTAASFQRYAQLLLRYHSGADGIFSIKVHWSHFDRLRRAFGFDLSWLPQPVVWVRLRRSDHLAQAISLHRAHQTMQWSATQPPRNVRPRYDGREIAALIRSLQREDEAWDPYFAERGIQPLELSYEQLDTDYEGSIRRVLAAVGVEAHHVPPPQMKRQADHINEEWRRRFIAEQSELDLAPRFLPGEPASPRVGPEP